MPPRPWLSFSHPSWKALLELVPPRWYYFPRLIFLTPTRTANHLLTAQRHRHRQNVGVWEHIIKKFPARWNADNDRPTDRGPCGRHRIVGPSQGDCGEKGNTESVFLEKGFLCVGCFFSALLDCNSIQRGSDSKNGPQPTPLFWTEWHSWCAAECGRMLEICALIRNCNEEWKCFFFFLWELPFLFTVDDEENQTKGIVCILNPDRLNALVLLWSIWPADDAPKWFEEACFGTS